MFYFCYKRVGDINSQNKQDITPLMISTQKKLTHTLYLLTTDKRVNFYIIDNNCKIAFY